jgi:glycosyltransferase involved in cell wall biosynthesis
MSRPVVSVIVPTYNCTELLPQALGSVLGQGLPPGDLELIVVDDGSIDDVAEALAPFDGAVTLLRQANAGPAAARNRGVAASHGTYVAFLDADDYWLPGCLAAMLAVAARNAPALVTVDLYYETNGVREAQSVFERGRLDAFFDLAAAAQYRRALEGGLFSYMTLMPRRLFDELGGFDPALHFGEDYDLSLRCLARGIPVRAVRRPLAVYRYLRAGASTTIWSSAKIRSLLRMLRPHRRYVPAARWRSLQSRLVYLRFYEAVQRRAWLAAAISGAQLAARPRFCLAMLRARRMRTVEP